MIDIYAMEKNLTGDYRESFSKISVYGTMIPIDKSKYNDRVMNIYDCLMTAQSENTPVNKIIGNDIEQFCKIYFKNHDFAESVLNIFKRVFTLMIITFIYTGLMLLFTYDSSTSILDMTVDIMSIIKGLAIGVAIIFIQNLISKNFLFKTDKLKTISYSVINAGIFIVLFIIAFLIAGNRQINVPAMVILSVSGGFVILYIFAQAIRRYLHKDTSLNSQGENMTYRQRKAMEREFSIESDKADTAHEMAKRLQKINEKRISKNKPEMSYEEFASLIQSEHRFYKNSYFYVFILLAAVLILKTVLNWGDEDFALSFAINAVVSSLSYLLWVWIARIIGEVAEAQRRILQECSERNITILQYTKDAHK